MAEPDYSLAAHSWTPPAENPIINQLQGIERYRILQNQNKITGLEAQQKQIDTDALKNYGDNGDSRALKGATPELRTGAVAGERSEQENKKDVMSRDAAYIHGEKDPKIKQYLWEKKKEEYVKKGWVPKEIADKFPTPHDEVLGNMIRGNVGVTDYRTSTGQTAGAEAAGRAPYVPEQTEPGKTVQYPAVRPGGPLAGKSPVGDPFGGTPSFSPNATMPNVTAPGTTTTILPPGAKPPTVAVDKTAPATPGNNSYSKEVPEVPVGHDLPTGKGIVQPGIDPVRQAARAEGLKKFNEDIEPGAAAAAKTRASLGIMKAGLDKGVTTDRLGELKTSIGGFLYAMTKDPELTKNATGLDVSNQEVFNKESTRMGLTFARQTEGAREAVQAIRIALGANPSLLNTEAGNRKIIAIMEQSSKYVQERAKAAQAYMQKNDGHLTGFDTWFSNSHPPAGFISKAVPYAVPPRRDQLQNGVTYEFPFSKNAKGEPMMHRGTWDEGTGHFDPVKE